MLIFEEIFIEKSQAIREKVIKLVENEKKFYEGFLI
jgi:hypothetical protein